MKPSVKYEGSQSLAWLPHLRLHRGQRNHARESRSPEDQLYVGYFQCKFI